MSLRLTRGTAVCCVLEQDMLSIQSRKTGNSPNMTEKLLTETSRFKKNPSQ